MARVHVFILTLGIFLSVRVCRFVAAIDDVCRLAFGSHVDLSILKDLNV